MYSCGHKNFVWEMLNFTSHLYSDSKQHACVQLISAQRFFHSSSVAHLHPAQSKNIHIIYHIYLKEAA